MPRKRTPAEQDTLVTCLACGGKFERGYQTGAGYKMSRCQWCMRGAMTSAMVTKWTNRKRKDS